MTSTQQAPPAITLVDSHEMRELLDLVRHLCVQVERLDQRIQEAGLAE